ncbi:MAG: hypothetical protein HY820_17055 [Acidobacteria bacterium]|nr:hypothetical protein [Acidobacteriota bacterium]
MKRATTPYPLNISALLMSPFESDHVVLRQVFSHSNWSLRTATDCEQALELLRETNIPVVLCSADSRLDSWKTIVRETASMENPPRVIVFSRLADERLWGDVIHNGGYSLLESPFDMRDIVTNVSLAWHSWYHELRQGEDRRHRMPELVRAAAVGGV